MAYKCETLKRTSGGKRCGEYRGKKSCTKMRRGHMTCARMGNYGGLKRCREYRGTHRCAAFKT